MSPQTTPAGADADKSAWTRSVADTLTDFATDAEQGLKSQDASERQIRYGHNQLRAAKSRHVGSIIFDQFRYCDQRDDRIPDGVASDSFDGSTEETRPR